VVQLSEFPDWSVRIRDEVDQLGYQHYQPEGDKVLIADAISYSLPRVIIHDEDEDWIGDFVTMTDVNDKLQMISGFDWRNDEDDDDWIEEFGPDLLSEETHAGVHNGKGIHYVEFCLWADDDSNLLVGWRAGSSSGGLQYGSGTINLIDNDEYNNLPAYCNEPTYTGGGIWNRLTADDHEERSDTQYSPKDEWHINLYTYYKTGSYVSQEIDTTVANPGWTKVILDSILGGATINLYFDSSDIPSFTPVWDANSLCGQLVGGNDEELTIPAGKANGQYARYKLDVIANGGKTVELDNMRFYYIIVG